MADRAATGDADRPAVFTVARRLGLKPRRELTLDLLNGPVRAPRFASTTSSADRRHLSG